MSDKAQVSGKSLPCCRDTTDKLMCLLNESARNIANVKRNNTLGCMEHLGWGALDVLTREVLRGFARGQQRCTKSALL